MLVVRDNKLSRFVDIIYSFEPLLYYFNTYGLEDHYFVM